MSEKVTATPVADNEALDFGKKKKKKTPIAMVLAEAEPSSAVATLASAEDKENNPVVGTEAVAPVADAADAEEDFDFGKKKAKKSNKVKFDTEEPEIFELPSIQDDKKEDQKLVSESDFLCSWQGTERDYTYDELLTRVINIMFEKNPDYVTGDKKKFIMKPPQVARVGTKKTSFSNFADICKLLKRQEKHLLNFLLAELGTSGSLDINKQLTFKGRFQQKQIENVLRRYIKEYVTCHTCRSPETNLVKEERLFFLQCEVCGSRCSVASIKLGFQAQVGKRAAVRARAT